MWLNLDLDLGPGTAGTTSAVTLADSGSNSKDRDAGQTGQPGQTARPQCLQSSLHEALPVLQGTKRVLQRWYHYGASDDVANEGAGLHAVCDTSGSCREYAQADE